MLKITQTIGTVTLIKDVIIITLFVRQFLWPLLNKKLEYRKNLLIVPIVVLLAWTAIATLRADSLVLGVLRARDVILYLLLYFGVLYLPHSRTLMKRRLMWFVSGLVVLLLLGGYQWFWAMDSAVLRYDPVREIWIPRISSVMAHPSIFGQYLVAAVFLCGAIVWHTRNSWRWLMGLLVVAGVLSVFLTYSRAVWMGLVGGVGIVALAYIWQVVAKRLSRKTMSNVLLVGILLIVVSSAVIYRWTPVGAYVRSAIDPTYGSNEERIVFMVRLIAPLSNREAMVGKGLGDVLVQNFRGVDLSTYDIASGEARSVQLTKNRTLVDNQYLKTFIEMGLAGLLIYAWIYWLFLKAAWQKFGSGSKGERVIAWWALGFLAAFIVQAAFIDIWDIWPTNAMFWVIAALVSYSSTKRQTSV